MSILRLFLCSSFCFCFFVIKENSCHCEHLFVLLLLIFDVARSLILILFIYLFLIKYLSTLCRQVVLDFESDEPLLVTMRPRYSTKAVIKSRDESVRNESIGGLFIYRLALVLKSEFSVNYVRPAPRCIINNGDCLPFTFKTVPNSEELKPDVIDREKQQEPTHLDVPRDFAHLSRQHVSRLHKQLQSA